MLSSLGAKIGLFGLNKKYFARFRIFSTKIRQNSRPASYFWFIRKWIDRVVCAESIQPADKINNQNNTNRTVSTVRFRHHESATLSPCQFGETVLAHWHAFRKEKGEARKASAEGARRKVKTKTIKNITIMTIKPLADRVLVLPAPAEEKVGGIIIPDTAKEKPQRGKVIAVGEGTKDEKMILKADDVVLYGKYAGTEIENEGMKYLMMRQSDVLAIVTE